MDSLMKKLLEDVLLQILLRLPVKSLLRFKSVCKVWCSLIKSPDFVEMHLNHPTIESDHILLIKRCLNDKVTSVLSFYSNTESLNIVLPDFKIPYIDHRFIKLLGPCNGIVCITDYRTIVLGNPVTKEFTLLPPRPFGCPQDMLCFNEGLGFGFDANANEYKVIRIVEIQDEYTYPDVKILKAEVYRHNTSSWREIDYALPMVWYKHCFEIFFHGATHWYGVRGDYQKIISFCITTEVFREFDFPDNFPFLKGNTESLVVLNDSLAMLSFTFNSSDIETIDIWVMREYGISESWTKQSTIGPLLAISHFITLSKNSALLFERTNGQLISYAIETQEVKEFDIFGYPESLRGFVFKESLVSVKK